MSFISPVHHNVPNSNNYKNVNITNFSGTSYSDNLFDGKSSGCSDSENIYINEENILAVRPRLQHVADLENIKEVKQVDVIDTDLMIYYVKDLNDNFKIILSDKKTAGNQDNDKIIPVQDLGKCSFFKDSNNKLICASSTGLYEIKDSKLTLIDTNHPDTYIPTVRTGMTFGDSLSGIETGETPNILSNKYYNEYQYSLDWLSTIPKDYVENRKYDMSDVIKHIEQGVYEFNMKDSSDEDTDLEKATFVDFKNKRYVSFYEGSILNRYLPRIFIVNDKGDNVVEWTSSFKSYNIDYDANTVAQAFLPNTENTIIKDDWLLTMSSIQYFKTTNHIAISFDKIPIETAGSTIRYNTKLDVSDFVNTTSIIDNILSTHPQNVTYRSFVRVKNDKIYGLITINIPGSTYCLSFNEYLSVILSGNNNVVYDSIKSDFIEITKTDDTVTIDDFLITDDLKGIAVMRTTTSAFDGLYRNIPNEINILQTDCKSSHMLWSTDYVYAPRSENKSLEYLKLFDIGANKILVCLRERNASEKSNGYYDSLDKAVYNGASEIGMLELTNNTINIFSDERLKDCYLYNIPKTKSFLAFKQTINDNSIKYDEYLYTNYSVNSGSFKINTWEYESLGNNFVNIIDHNHYIIVNDYDISINELIITNEDVPSSSLEIRDLYIYCKYKFTIEPNLNIRSITEIVERSDYNELYKDLKFPKHKILDNRIWLFGKDNILRWSLKPSAFYFPEDYYTEIGTGDVITNVLPLSTSSLGVFQKHSTTVLSEDDNGNYIFQKTIKTPKGCLGEDQATVIPTTNYPVVINDDSVAMLTQSENGVVEDSVFTIISEDIFKKFAVIKNKEHIKTHVHGYYIYFYWSEDSENNTNVWCLDCRTLSWFRWTLPIKVKFMYESDETTNLGVERETRLITDDSEYVLTNMGISIDGNDDSIFNEDISAYVDNLKNNNFRRIPWYWKSRIQTLGTVNYLKKITSLQLIFSDKQRYNKADKDGIFTKNNKVYYSIKTYRKKSELLDGYFESALDGVGIQRIKIRLPKCDFAEIMLSNFEDYVENSRRSTNNYMVVEKTTNDDLLITDQDSILDIYDRLHLIGITLKILLSEGLNG